MTKPKLRQFNSPNRIEEMLKEIQDNKGYNTVTSVIIQAIINMHGETFKDYIYKKKNITEEERIQAKINKKIIIKEIKTEELNEKRQKICDLLNGEKYQDASGVWHVKYYDYANKKRNEQIIPFDLLSEDLVQGQYYPSKEKVLKLQKDKKVDY